MTCQTNIPGVIACTVDDRFAWFWNEPDMAYRCLDCDFEIDADRNGNDSCRFRSEEHRRLTGHRVGLFLERWEDYPDKPIYELGELQ